MWLNMSRELLKFISSKKSIKSKNNQIKNKKAHKQNKIESFHKKG
jgi:hypothetical protein